MTDFATCLGAELKHSGVDDFNAARVMAIMGAHRCSAIGELPQPARGVVLEIIRRGKQAGVSK